MITDYKRVREIMAENGYEHTPDEAKGMVDNFNVAVKKLTQYDAYQELLNMTYDEMVEKVNWMNEGVKKKNQISLKDFKALRQFILDLGPSYDS